MMLHVLRPSTGRACMLVTFAKSRPLARPELNSNLTEVADVRRTILISQTPIVRKEDNTGRFKCGNDICNIEITGRDVHSSYSLPKCHFKRLSFHRVCRGFFTIDKKKLENCRVSLLLVERNYVQMVTFLKNGSRQLDNSIDVGFVQFSTNVTYSDWLPRRWSKEDYLDQTPSSFDAGYTNTPAALDEAGRLFKVCFLKITVLPSL